jgi:hypothetical protein
LNRSIRNGGYSTPLLLVHSPFANGQRQDGQSIVRTVARIGDAAIGKLQSNADWGLGDASIHECQHEPPSLCD